MDQQHSKNGENPWSFLKTNSRQPKPRSRGLTEIRASYYSVLGPRYLEDVLESAGAWIDSIKFAGGAFTLLPEATLRRIIEIAHCHDVLVSTGGFMEYVLTQGEKAVRQYIRTCKDMGFDIIEISSGFITLPTDDWLRLVEWVQAAGLKAKPEVGIQFGAGGSTSSEGLKGAGQRDAGYAIRQARRFLEAGAYLVMIESEGITENVEEWRTEVAARFIDELGMERIMFEAAEPAVFEWYLRNYGHGVNLFVDHSQVLQLECLRQGIWGTEHSWGRIQGL